MSKKDIKVFSRIAIIVIIIYLGLDLKCPFRLLFGIPCAGCGMTRAIIEAIHLNFKGAFYYHPLFFIIPTVVIFFLFIDKFSKRFTCIYWVTIVSLFIMVYIIRLYEGIIP